MTSSFGGAASVDVKRAHWQSLAGCEQVAKVPETKETRESRERDIKSSTGCSRVAGSRAAWRGDSYETDGCICRVLEQREAGTALLPDARQRDG
jgi:hypothetical protein